MFGRVMHHSQLFHARGSSTPERKGDVEVPDNLQWSKLCEGSENGATTFVAGLYSVIWWATSLAVCASVILTPGEISGLFRVTTRQIMLSPKSATHTYDQTRQPGCPGLHHLWINIAYFGAVSKNDILYSGRVTA